MNIKADIMATKDKAYCKIQYIRSLSLCTRLLFAFCHIIVALASIQLNHTDFTDCVFVSTVYTELSKELAANAVVHKLI